MTEIAYGPKYEATKSLSRVEIAKLIRADIKAAVKAGTLPKGKYSVVTKGFSGGGSIDVKVYDLDVPAAVFNPEHLAAEVADPHYRYPRGERYTKWMKDVLDEVTAIHAAYNFDGSDSMTDYFHVRYYGHVSLGWEWEAARKAAEIAALSTMKLSPKEVEIVAVSRAAENGIAPLLVHKHKTWAELDEVAKAAFHERAEEEEREARNPRPRHLTLVKPDEGPFADPREDAEKTRALNDHVAFLKSIGAL